MPGGVGMFSHARADPRSPGPDIGNDNFRLFVFTWTSYKGQQGSLAGIQMVSNI